MTKTYKILHISDLHFGELNKAKIRHFFSKPKEAAELISDAFKQQYKNNSPDLITIAGDFICNPEKSKQWAQASQFLEDLINWFSLSEEKFIIDGDPGNVVKIPPIIVVPGNHDINRGDSLDEAKEYGLYSFDSHILQKLYGTNLKIYSNKNQANHKRECFVFQKASKPYIGIVGLDSPHKDLNDVVENIESHLKATFEDNPWKFDHGFIDDAMLAKCSAKLKHIKKDVTLIALVHHHIIGGPSITSNPKVTLPDSSSISNYQKVLRWSVDNNISMVLHGHKHEHVSVEMLLPISLGVSKPTIRKRLILEGVCAASLKDYNPEDELELGFKVYNILRQKNIVSSTVDIFEYRAKYSNQYIRIDQYDIDLNTYKKGSLKHRKAGPGILKTIKDGLSGIVTNIDNQMIGDAIKLIEQEISIIETVSSDAVLYEETSLKLLNLLKEIEIKHNKGMEYSEKVGYLKQLLRDMLNNINEKHDESNTKSDRSININDIQNIIDHAEGRIMD